ncbi:MAG: bifunctional phosphoribosylaminoimidazolecarboxamide formyltransferase/IMP cyclohydrolase [Alphaproteobacteria bacterium]|nr:bifunctional phosphoribosylaminoimidazolecarboxamide formyltransferase/IMP cyclohydrolase [Alphaproteobacteria bacterium]
MRDLVRVRRALVSVSDKSGLGALAATLARHDIEIVSTGGTAGALRDAGVSVVDVAERTGFPEMLDGRVKTLHPHIHGAILARRDDPDHERALGEHAITPIDLVVVSLYPFEEALRSGADPETCTEQIDIGGPALIRAAAKNWRAVAVVVDVVDYTAVGAELDANAGCLSLATRRKLAATAYARTASYDAAIAAWMSEQSEEEEVPRRLVVAASDPQVLRYGENPHQRGLFYRTGDERCGVGTARQIQGRELSYNNLNDTHAAIELVAELDRPGIAIIKHANPCGVAQADSLSNAYERAFACDRTSAFGGIIAANRTLDPDTASRIIEILTEVVVAPEISPGAREILARRTGLRVLETGALPDPGAAGREIRQLAGGLLVQDRDTGRVGADDLRVVTRRAPCARECADLLLAFRIAKHVKSNAIVYVRNGASVGIGAGQMSRVDSARIAARKARDAAGEGEPATVGSVVASDAFFPFADGLLAAVEAGATAVIQPGGSVRDDEVIRAADEHDIAMVMTGIRHFRH